MVTANPSVATVDENGVVTAMAEGNAVITATSVDQNASGMAATATCNVTVRGLAAVDADREVPGSAWGPVRFLPAWFLSEPPILPDNGRMQRRSCQRIWRFCKPTGTVQNGSSGETAEDEKTVTVESPPRMQRAGRCIHQRPHHSPL